MIPLIPAIVIAAAFAISMIAYVGSAYLELQDLRGDAATNMQERLQERLRGEYEGSPTNIQQASILSEWTDSSTITGILVKCPDGTTHTIQISNVTIQGGSTMSITDLGTGTKSKMEDAAGRC